jgi:methylated-DNA-[protein]-cysteine S-methyltransferase
MDMDRPTGDSARVCAFETALGWMAIAWTDERLERFTIGHASGQAALIAAGGQAVAMDDAPLYVQRIAERLQNYAAGEREDFSDVELDLSYLTPFQRKIADECRRIPRGKTLTYGELAERVGSPGAARAVGNVMARNRFPIIVPCHRVVGSAGGLGGFSAPEGIGLKKQLLRREGCQLAKLVRERQLALA